MVSFRISAGVYVSERDASTVTAAVATTTGALAGVFRWGPVGERTLLSSEKYLKRQFGAPSSTLNAETWFCAANYLAYSNGLYVVRCANTTGSNTDIANSCLSAIGLNTGNTAANSTLLSSIVKNSTDFLTKTFPSSVSFVARCPGDMGNSLKVSVCDSATAYNSSINLVPNTDIATNSSISFAVGSNAATVRIQTSGTGTNAEASSVGTTVTTSLIVGDYIKAGNNSIGTQYLKVTSIGAATSTGNVTTVSLTVDQNFNLSTAYVSNTINRYWEYYASVGKPPGQSAYQTAYGSAVNDQMHVAVVDAKGVFTGVPGTVLETYDSVSRATDAKNESGSSVFWKNVINGTSQYVWAAQDLTTAAANTANNLIASSAVTPTSIQLIGGQDGLDENNVSIGVITAGYDLFANADEVDIGVIIAGVARGGTTLANYLIGNIASVRRDVLVTISSQKSDTVNANGNEMDNLVNFRSTLTNTSYAVMDSGYKYQYDKYNDVFRWVPLCGDIAGTIARTDDIADPWFSPGGFNRGQIKNVVKLAYNPASDKIRDVLYKADINPVVSFKGQGTVLYGDKTLLGQPSAFDRINVRRLFIVLEKSIARASQALLFELNDEFTRAQFINMVEPFLREVKGRRGIYDFKVVCDETNNTQEVLDKNGFVGDIYVKPARSINTINLNFIATRSGVNFTEVAGIPQ